MLGLLGILGAIFAGFTADSLLVSLSKNKSADIEGDTGDSPPEEAATGDAPADLNGDLVDWAASRTENQGTEDVQRGADDTRSTDTPADAPDPLDLQGGEDDDILAGEGGDDLLAGKDGNDLLDGRGGDDVLQGGAGNDHLHGNEGRDSLSGGAGNDVLHGEDGADLITGDEGDDALYGHEGDDDLSGGSGDDSLLGGAGDDTLQGDDGQDWLNGGFGDDILIGGQGSDTLDGGAGDDTLWGGDGDSDFLNGGTGDDTLLIGAGDYASGGEGADVFTLTGHEAGEDPAWITDFNPDEDQLIVVYDPVAHPDPMLSLVPQAGSADVTLMLDGLPLAHISGAAGLSTDMMRLVQATA